MSLDEIVSIAISADTRTVTRAGFGVPMILRAHSRPKVVETYTSLKGMTDDSWSATDPAVTMATKIASQNPRPRSWKVGKRASAFTQTVRITPVNVSVGYVYAFDIVVGSDTTAISYTVPASATVATISTALAGLITAIAGISAAAAATHVTITHDSAGELFDVVGMPSADDCLLSDLTTDPGVAADLSAIESEDDDWYVGLLDSNSAAEIAAAAAWFEARKKLFLCNTSDSDVVDGSSSADIMSSLQTSAYARTSAIYSKSKLLNYTAAAWAGNRLPSDPGSSTWAHKTLSSVSVDALTAGEVAVIRSKSGNVYTNIGGNNVATFGVTSSGEYIDVVRFIDWLQARMQERVFGTLLTNGKIPYTDTGIQTIVAQVVAQLSEGVVVGGLAANPAPSATAPKASDISTNVKGTRVLPDITFEGALAGAIHAATISGRVSV